MSLPRYPEYKDSGVAWLGEVPGHWEVKRLKNLATIQNGSDYKHIQADSEGYPVIGSGGEFARAREYLYEGESVLLGRKGTIDRPLYINGAFWPVDTMFYTMIKQETCAKYLYYCALTIRFDLYSTSTALPSMTQADLSNIHFAVPDFEEQNTIATFLDRETAKIDALIAEQEKLIALLAEKRQATISHAVTKGLNPDAPMKDSGVEWLGDVPVHWDVKRLKHLCKVQTGGQDTADAVEDGLYPFFVRSQTVERINSFSFDCEAVLTAGDGVGVGKVFHHVIGKFDFHQRVYMMNNFKLVSGSFFFHYLASMFHKVALDGVAKSTVDSLRMPVFMNFMITVPSEDEQMRIVDFISTETLRLDALTDEAIRAIALLKERRTALISAAVTGKIDVRTLA